MFGSTLRSIPVSGWRPASGWIFNRSVTKGGPVTESDYHFEVRHNEKDGRFEAIREGQVVGLLRYTVDGERFYAEETVVDPAASGHGIAGALAKAVLEWQLEAGDKQVIANCPFVASYLNKHPEYKPLELAPSKR
nr:GNAT family N-acetyltransferase [Mobiluncus porci]